MKVSTLTTQSGSQYVVKELDDGSYWLTGQNVPNPNSVPIIDGQHWEIERPRPWPAVLGSGVLLLSKYFGSPDDSRRLLGGGKLTSAVTGVVDA